MPGKNPSTINQSINQSIRQPNKQSINQPIHQSMNQWFNDSINQSIESIRLSVGKNKNCLSTFDFLLVKTAIIYSPIEVVPCFSWKKVQCYWRCRKRSDWQIVSRKKIIMTPESHKKMEEEMKKFCLRAWHENTGIDQCSKHRLGEHSNDDSGQHSSERLASDAAPVAQSVVVAQADSSGKKLIVGGANVPHCGACVSADRARAPPTQIRHTGAHPGLLICSHKQKILIHYCIHIHYNQSINQSINRHEKGQ